VNRTTNLPERVEELLASGLNMNRVARKVGFEDRAALYKRRAQDAALREAIASGLRRRKEIADALKSNGDTATEILDELSSLLTEILKDVQLIRRSQR
jgi:hypothetical protein